MINNLKAISGVQNLLKSSLTDTGENVQKVDATNFDSALSHTRRSDASEKNKIACPLLNVFALEQVSSPRLYRLRTKYKLRL